MKNRIETRPSYKSKSWGKQKKSIRLLSTYLSDLEEEEKTAGGCQRRSLVEVPSSPSAQVLVLEAGTAKSGYIAILIGDIFG